MKKITKQLLLTIEIIAPVKNLRANENLTLFPTGFMVNIFPACNT